MNSLVSLGTVLYSAFGIGTIFVLLLLDKLNCDVKLLINHGKTLTRASSRWSVPKSLFLHFYFVGFFLNAALFYVTPGARLYYFLFHVLRRFMETMFIMKYRRTSHMHFAHYLVGLTFYPIAGHLVSQKDHVPQFFPVCYAVLMLLQLDCHQILGRLSRSNKRHRTVPKIRLYWLMNCPHYMIEILIYVLFLSDQNSLPLRLFLAFVVLNLSVSMARTNSWYKSQTHMLDQGSLSIE